MLVFDIIFWILGGVLLLTVMYLYFIAALSLIPEKDNARPQEPAIKFVIVIPAHNEAMVIGKTLESIKRLNYPKEFYETFVVADNCNDETAQVARHHGVNCIERKDAERKGKGFALQWAFERLKEGKCIDTYDAFIIIDADTIVDSNFLASMDYRIAKGELAIQGYYDVINPDVSPMASLSYLGFVLSRNLRYKGRSRIGWASNLLGNGMCFAKEVINRYGWNATSIVEDVEYAVTLLLNGVRVSFAPEAKIFAEIPTTFKDSKIQRSRWDIGKFQMRNKYLVQLIKSAIRKRDISYLDTAIELMIPPFSLFLVFSFVSFGLYLAILFNGFNILSIIWFATVSALVVYVLVGLIMAKSSWKIYKNLIIYIPFFLFWRVETLIWGYISQVGKHWIKTERREAR
jgi:cellulose synthase/poly-beta-1,6-N-acetylglucosamine synthase-like glycosyltransferase